MNERRTDALRLARTARRSPADVSLERLLSLCDADDSDVRLLAESGLHELAKHGPEALEPDDQDVSSALNDAETYSPRVLGPLAAINDQFVEEIKENLGDPSEVIRRDTLIGLRILARCDVATANPLLPQIVDRFDDTGRVIAKAETAAAHIVARDPTQQASLVDALVHDEDARGTAGSSFARAVIIRSIHGEDTSVFAEAVEKMVEVFVDTGDDSLQEGIEFLAGRNRLKELEGHAGAPELLVSHRQQLVDTALSVEDVYLGSALGQLGSRDRETAALLYDTLDRQGTEAATVLTPLARAARHFPSVVDDPSVVEASSTGGDYETRKSAERVLSAVSEAQVPNDAPEFSRTTIDPSTIPRLLDKYAEKGECERLRFVARDDPEQLAEHLDLFVDRLVNGRDDLLHDTYGGQRTFAAGVLADVAASVPSAIEPLLDDIATALADPVPMVRAEATAVVGSYVNATGEVPDQSVIDQIERTSHELGIARPVAVATLVLSGERPAENDSVEATISAQFTNPGSFAYRPTIVAVEALRVMETEAAYRHIRAIHPWDGAGAVADGHNEAIANAVERAHAELADLEE